ncbi:tetratricopeptide repeat protein [Micromonospora sp. WMMD882]|uniref:tetratricopeptide repeat protein n=1 Tax=Micromonospora sp. WMMD882 TaxID=3015151 RepID=UPI00248C93BA|nr:tetratricopeptide repeat protein [Micromonospora sp. WMMD882]WBB80071.1 tetratricopeptide repeat protein [Micromonospora sp. WMMD882]
MEPTPHRWIRAARHRDRRRLLADGLDAPVLADLDAHRWLRGPYTAVGALLRGLVPTVLAERPDLVAAHEIELLSVAPELRELVPATRETLTSLAVPEERTRFYPRARTLRLAHGLVEFLDAWLRHLDDGPRCLLVENLHEADPTDREFFAVLLRRADPTRLRLRLATTAAPVEEPPGPAAAPLGPALRRYAAPVDGDRTGPLADLPRPTGAETTGVAASNAETSVEPAGMKAAGTEAAREYVRGDCVDDDPTVLAAYRTLPAAVRADLHDARADELLATGERSWRLGAVTLHRERGGAPATAGVQALRDALEYCVNLGFYHATLEYGARGRALVDWSAQMEHWWAFTTKMTTSLMALGRPIEALALYDEARAHTDSAMVHMQAAYATGMIYTRHLETGERDHRQARAWCNAAIAYARLAPDRQQSAAHLVFNRNGLALVAMHEGKLDEALDLVTRGLAELDEALGAGQHHLHRSVLRHNRSQLLAALGRREEALAELDAVIEVDPNHVEYHLDRGGLLRRLGRDEEALASYDQAIRLSPPFPEVHYNRADVLLELGAVQAALAGFDRVLDLEPEHLDARINRAGLRQALDDTEGAWADVRAGLDLAPGNAYLLCVRGQLELEHDLAQARRTLSAALAVDPTLAAAWAARGAAAYQEGDLAAAVADLSHALALDDDPAVRFNRGLALADAGRHAEADADFQACAAADPDLAAEVREHRARLLPA